MADLIHPSSKTHFCVKKTTSKYSQPYTRECISQYRWTHPAKCPHWTWSF